VGKESGVLYAILCRHTFN